MWIFSPIASHTSQKKAILIRMAFKSKIAFPPPALSGSGSQVGDKWSPSQPGLPSSLFSIKFSKTIPLYNKTSATSNELWVAKTH
jgi:hypothetical protein